MASQAVQFGEKISPLAQLHPGRKRGIGHTVGKQFGIDRLGGKIITRPEQSKDRVALFRAFVDDDDFIPPFFKRDFFARHGTQVSIAVEGGFVVDGDFDFAATHARKLIVAPNSLFDETLEGRLKRAWRKERSRRGSSRDIQRKKARRARINGFLFPGFERKRQTRNDAFLRGDRQPGDLAQRSPTRQNRDQQTETEAELQNASILRKHELPSLFPTVMSFFASDDESLHARLEILPLLTDRLGFLIVDAVIRLDRFADDFKQFAEFAHHAARFVENALLARLAKVRHRIRDKKSARFMT